MRKNCFIIIVVEHGIENLTTCVYSLMDFYLIEKSYPQTREIANFWENLTYYPPPPPPPNEETGFAPLANT